MSLMTTKTNPESNNPESFFTKISVLILGSKLSFYSQTNNRLEQIKKNGKFCISRRFGLFLNSITLCTLRVLRKHLFSLHQKGLYSNLLLTSQGKWSNNCFPVPIEFGTAALVFGSPMLHMQAPRRLSILGGSEYE